MKKSLGKQALVLVLCALALMGGALAAGLSDGDSLISLSYLQNIFFPDIAARGGQMAQERFDAVYADAAERLEKAAEEYLSQASPENGRSYSTSYTRQTLSLLDQVFLSPGSGLILEVGSAKLGEGGSVVDVTTGRELFSGEALTAGHRYLAPEEEAVVVIQSDSVRLSVQGEYMTQVSGAEATPFTDIAIGDWYHSAVQAAYREKLVNGAEDGTVFQPNVTMSRAMMVTILYHLAGDPEEEMSVATRTFPDVRQGAWYEPYIRWAADQGIIAGTPEGTFNPDLTLTRQEVVQLVYNFARSYLHMELESTGDLSDFEDGAQVAGWSSDAMSWAVGTGLITVLAPTRQAPRAEVAAVLVSFKEKIL